MVSLETHLNTLDFAAQLETVRDLLTGKDAVGNNKAKSCVTFWGSRVITIEGYSGSVYLDDVICRVLDASNIFDRNRNQITDAKRAAVDQIEAKLNEFYAQTDVEVSQANCLTRFFVWIRELTCGYPYTPRFFLEEGVIARNLRRGLEI